MSDESPARRGPLSWTMTTAALTIVAARQLFPSIDADSGSGALFVLAAFAVGLLAVIDLAVRNGPRATIPVFIFILAGSTAAAAYQHPALLMFGEWIGVACIWAALRRSSAPAMIKQVVLLVVVLAVSESALTIHQVRTVIPELLERYRRGDATMMRELAQVGVEPGFMFQSRLEARLPWGTFGHTNTLAGFLMLSTPFLLTLCVAAWTAAPSVNVWISRGLATTLFTLVLVALALTKGRSAWIGTAAAAGVMALSSAAIRSRIRRYWPWAAAVFFMLAVGFVWKAGNAVQSLGYRLEYWQGTLPVVKKHPWLGVGWGSFRDHYLEHKLIHSSEEVADPHNLLMELAACAGLPAALAYVWWLTASVRRLLVRSTDDAAPVGRQSLFHSFELGVGLATASLVVVGLGYSSSWTEIGLLGIIGAFFAAAVLDRLSPSISVKNWRIAAAAAVVGLHVHLLAAGGVGHPGMMLACWGIVAVAGPFDVGDRRKRLWDLGLLVAILVLSATTGSLGLEKRIVERDPLLGRIRSVNDARLQNRDAVTTAFNKALALTPGDADLWTEKAKWQWRRLEEQPGEGLAYYPGGLAAFDRALELQPLRSQFWIERGMFKLVGVSRRLTPPGNAGSGAADFQQAVRRYPNSPTRQAEEVFAAAAVGQEAFTPASLSQSLDEWRMVKSPATSEEIGRGLGREAAARVGPGLIQRLERLATRALDLDAGTPHLDKKLLPAERAWLAGLSDELKRRRPNG